MRLKVVFLLFISFTVLADGDEKHDEITCDIEGKVIQLFFDDLAPDEAEGYLESGELIVARQIDWEHGAMPSLATLEKVRMRIEFPFRLEKLEVDCEVYHPSRWWFNSPEVLELFERYSPIKH